MYQEHVKVDVNKPTKENWFTDSADYEHLAATLNNIVNEGRQIYSIYCLSSATWVVISYKYE